MTWTVPKLSVGGGRQHAFPIGSSEGTAAGTIMLAATAMGSSVGADPVVVLESIEEDADGGGLGDPRNKALLQVTRLIQHLEHTQT